jgi:molybdopterin biosynthesis enzyme
VINTGAKLPDDANAVIQIEDTQVHEFNPIKKDGLHEKSIRINTECSMNQDIRFVFEMKFVKKRSTKNIFRNIGADVNIGELVLETNVPLGPAEIGLLATVGLQKIRVYDKPHVVILSTGNEVSF